MRYNKLCLRRYAESPSDAHTVSSSFESLDFSPMYSNKVIHSNNKLKNYREKRIDDEKKKKRIRETIKKTKENIKEEKEGRRRIISSTNSCDINIRDKRRSDICMCHMIALLIYYFFLSRKRS